MKRYVNDIVSLRMNSCSYDQTNNIGSLNYFKMKKFRLMVDFVTHDIVKLLTIKLVLTIIQGIFD